MYISEADDKRKSDGGRLRVKGEFAMIYILTHEFTMLEETEGLMQNMTLNTPIEVVTSEGLPSKDSGIALMALEKMKFAAARGEKVFARCTKLDGTLANLSVVNIKTPVKCDCGGGGQVGGILYGHVVMHGYVKADGQLLARSEYSRLFKFANDYNLLLDEDEWEKGMQGMYGCGDNSTTFRVPDLRGQFLRALDDGAGIDANRTIGSRQKGSLTTFDTDFCTSEVIGVGSEAGAYEDVGFDSPDLSDYPNAKSCWIGGSKIQQPLRYGIGATRPANTALIAQIKY